MRSNAINLQARLYLIGTLVLLVGLGSSLFIYLKAGNDPDDPVGYEITGGEVDPIAPNDSKRYLRDMEMYGGKANILASELTSWFAGLWHGRSLAFTLSGLSILTSSGLFFVGRRLSAGFVSDAGDETDRTGTH